MREIKKNIFLETIPYENRHISPRNLYIIRGEDRSLMVDTSNNTERDWEHIKGYGRCAWHRLPEAGYFYYP